MRYLSDKRDRLNHCVKLYSTPKPAPPPVVAQYTADMLPGEVLVGDDLDHRACRSIMGSD